MTLPLTPTALRYLATGSTLALCAAFPAGAQDISSSFSIESGRVDIAEFLSSYEADYSLAVLGSAVTWNFGSNLYAGADLSYGVALDDGASGLDNMSRLRLVGGYKMGQFDLYGAAGYAVANGAWNFGINQLEGTTYAIGTRYSINDRLAVRAEILKDDLEGSDGSKTATWDSTAVQIGAVYQF